jgi:hypothetical protein
MLESGVILGYFRYDEEEVSRILGDASRQILRRKFRDFEKSLFLVVWGELALRVGPGPKWKVTRAGEM